MPTRIARGTGGLVSMIEEVARIAQEWGGIRKTRPASHGRTRCGAGAETLPGPAIGELVLLAHPHLILEPDFYRCVGCELRTDFRHTLGEVFLNASMASAFCL